MKIKKSRPVIPYARQTIDDGDMREVSRVLRSPWLAQGPETAKFEQSLAKYCGAKFAVAVCNGTAALHLAYLTAGIKKGDEVITSPNTFVATTNMMLTVGAKPVFADVHLDTYNLDESKIEKLVTKRTKAIVPVHFAGHPCEMDRIKQIATKYKLTVIEDASHALGAEYKNKKIGSLSDMTIFSFHAVKPITTGEGGAIVTNNKQYYENVSLLRSHGVVKDEKGFNVMTDLGFNYRLTDLQAALGLSQLKKINKFLDKRHQIVSWYNQELSGTKQIILPRGNSISRSSWHIYVIRVTDKKDRLPLYNFLRKKGIGVNFHYPCVYSHPYYQKLGYQKTGGCPQADLYAQTCVTLPIFPNLSRKKVIYISQNIKKYFS